MTFAIGFILGIGATLLAAYLMSKRYAKDLPDAERKAQVLENRAEKHELKSAKQQGKGYSYYARSNLEAAEYLREKARKVRFGEI